ncbi:nitrogen fixation protein NifX [Ectothiorhodospiraceae bacterium BW-2]|nr:nitrogen fixation protein NifX [Ectothiorhodospiraceae bacterium BW-2]
MALQRRLQLIHCDTNLTDPTGLTGLSGEQFMQQALKVAFASSDLSVVDQHFGASKAFVIYAVTPEASRFVEVVEFGEQLQDGNEDKLTAKLEVLDGCIAVYSQAVGASAIRQLKSVGIQPVKVSHGAVISELLQQLQEELRQGPSSWLARAIEQSSCQRDDSSRFETMEREGWHE